MPKKKTTRKTTTTKTGATKTVTRTTGPKGRKTNIKIKGAPVRASEKARTKSAGQRKQNEALKRRAGTSVTAAEAERIRRRLR